MTTVLVGIGCVILGIVLGVAFVAWMLKDIQPFR